MIYIQLFYEFFKIGLFAIGGGMATIPFLQKLGVATGWFEQSLINDMLAISESTPGPIGINMATYVGYNVAGITGGIVASIATITPSIIITTAFAAYLTKNRQSKLMGKIFYGVRPVVTGLIAAAAYEVFRSTIFHGNFPPMDLAVFDITMILKLLLLVGMFVAIRVFKKHPLVYIGVSAVVGVVLGLGS